MATKVPFVDLQAQYQRIKPEVDDAIQAVIQEASFVGGRFVSAFETHFASMYGVRHCVGVANGTDALYIALKMLGIGPGDEVITVANSWISTAETISQVGATPVFVDIEPDYYTIDVSLIEEKISAKTKAIIPVHLFGHPADMDPIVALCKKHQLKLIEDCAQAHFAEYKGKRVGLFGDIATFSFYPGKNLGAYGDAGAIITNNDDLAERCRRFANHGGLEKHQHEIVGINSRLDGIQAAVLDVKLNHIAEWTKERRELSTSYTRPFEGSEEFHVPKEADYAKAVYHLYVVRCPNRDQVRTALASAGIETAIHYPTPLPLLPVYQHLGYTEDDIPVASQYAGEIFSLPMYAELQDEQVRFVSEQLLLNAM